MNKVDMNSFSGNKAAYKAAFSDSDPESVFNGYEPDVSHLEAIRNLFAHRSGKIDGKFLSRIKGSDILKDCRVDDNLALTGDMLSFYTGRCVELAGDMFLFVDRWIYGNRTT